MIDKSYVMYHCHTDYSIQDSCTNFKEYIELAKRDGMKAIAFSEHGIHYNWGEKWGACKEAGIKYIHAVEIYLTETLDERIRDNYHTILVARNMEGLKELNRVVSMSTDLEHMYYKNRISFNEFLSLSSNIITTSACLASPLNKLDESHPMYEKLVKRYDFLEIQPHNMEDQIKYNQRLFELSKRYNKPLIAATDTHSSTPYKAECRGVVMKSYGMHYEDKGEINLAYMTYDELVNAFRKQGALSEESYMQAIENTHTLADMCEDIELDLAIKYPILYGSPEEDEKMLEKTIEEKLQYKIKQGIIPEGQIEGFRTSIEEEKRVFKKVGMSGFMLIMSEMISWCKDNGIPIGPARGSVGGSRVAYVTDIIDLNPEKWKTVFSRFCNEDRKEIGDIDIDVIESDRPKIFEHIVKTYGEDKTARVLSFGTAKGKKAIEIIGRYLRAKYEQEHGAEFTKENPWSLANVAKIKEAFEKDEEKARKKYKELFYYYDGVAGMKVSVSVHPAGMVVAPISLADNYGVFWKDDGWCLVLDMENVHDFTGSTQGHFW